MKRKTTKKRKSRPKHKSRTVHIWLVIMVVFIGELLLYTWCRVQYVKVGYEISKATENHQYLLALQRNLKIELAHLKSPARIEKIATEQLGLITPTPKQIIMIP